MLNIGLQFHQKLFAKAYLGLQYQYFCAVMFKVAAALAPTSTMALRKYLRTLSVLQYMPDQTCSLNMSIEHVQQNMFSERILWTRVLNMFNEHVQWRNTFADMFTEHVRHLMYFDPFGITQWFSTSNLSLKFPVPELFF